MFRKVFEKKFSTLTPSLFKIFTRRSETSNSLKILGELGETSNSLGIKGQMVVTSRFMRGGFAWFLILLLSLSCETEDPRPNPCISGVCDAKMFLPGEKDQNGYYHIKLNWNSDFMPYFFIQVVATEVIPEFRYNKVSVVSAKFDSDTFWTLDGVTWREPLYNPFTSNRTSSGTWLPTEITELNIDFFKGIDINLAQGSEVYFHVKDELFYTKRSIGPIPPQLKGDTVTVYMDVFWDAGNYSVQRKDFFEKFIIE